MTDLRKWKQLMETIGAPVMHHRENPPALPPQLSSQQNDPCSAMVDKILGWCEADCSPDQVKSVLWAMAQDWSQLAPLMKQYAEKERKTDNAEHNDFGANDKPEYEREHEGVEESATAGAIGAGAIASGVQEATKECSCREYNCETCFPETVNESNLRGWLHEAPDDEGPDDHVGREGTDVDFDSINKQGGVEDLGTDPDLKGVDDELGIGKASGESEDISTLIADIEEYQGLGISKAKRAFDINQLHQMPVDFVKKVHSLVCGEDEHDDANSPDISHESIMRTEEAEVKDIIESYRKLFKIHK